MAHILLGPLTTIAASTATAAIARISIALATTALLPTLTTSIRVLISCGLQTGREAPAGRVVTGLGLFSSGEY